MDIDELIASITKKEEGLRDIEIVEDNSNDED